MSILLICVIMASAIGLANITWMEGYIAGLRRMEERRREAVDRHREWVVTHWPEEGRHVCDGGGTGQQGGL